MPRIAKIAINIGTGFALSICFCAFCALLCILVSATIYNDWSAQCGRVLASVLWTGLGAGAAVGLIEADRQG